MDVIEQLRQRGGARVSVGGTAHDVRVEMLRRDPDDPLSDEPVLSLESAALLLAANSTVTCRFWLCRLVGHRAFKATDRPKTYFRCERTTREIP
jgi:hypothetical protein